MSADPVLRKARPGLLATGLLLLLTACTASAPAATSEVLSGVVASTTTTPAPVATTVIVKAPPATVALTDELSRELTSVGQLVWTRVDGGPGEVPRCCVRTHPDGGFLVVEGATLLRSDDGIQWFAEPGPPVAAASVTTGYVIDGVVWATAQPVPLGSGSRSLLGPQR